MAFEQYNYAISKNYMKLNPTDTK